MSSTYRLVVHCDENGTTKCLGLVEYLSADRLGLARMSDRHLTESGWLMGFRKGSTYDVCPACRTSVEDRLVEADQKAQQRQSELEEERA